MPIEYDLTLEAGNLLPGNVIRGELVSSSLDPILQPHGLLIVDFVSGPDSAGRISFQSFQLDSLTAYLNTQAAVREMLEDELAKERARWVKSTNPTPSGEVWEHVRVDSLLLALRRSMDPLPPLLGIDDRTPREIEEDARMEASYDTPNVMARFTVVIEVDWDDSGRDRTAEFRVASGEPMGCYLGIEGS